METGRRKLCFWSNVTEARSQGHTPLGLLRVSVGATGMRCRGGLLLVGASGSDDCPVCPFSVRVSDFWKSLSRFPSHSVAKSEGYRLHKRRAGSWIFSHWSAGAQSTLCAPDCLVWAPGFQEGDPAPAQATGVCFACRNAWLASQLPAG